ARRQLEAIRHFLVDELLPHDQAEDATIYPLVAEIIGGEDPTGPMSRAHLEIAHLVRVYERLLGELPRRGPGADDLRELRRVLYGLYAILQLHFAQEEESYLSLIDERTPAGREA
ncbi:MAG TPA: hemerythrin domain-containing protein, partial [Thermoanaerobaculia bacterium]|nr:hemerythrin domain-containing protein [Thermoanaerobaculia bacterium]